MHSSRIFLSFVCGNVPSIFVSCNSSDTFNLSASKKNYIGFSEETIGKRWFFTLPEKDIEPNSNKNLFSSVKNYFFTIVLLSYKKND